MLGLARVWDPDRGVLIAAVDFAADMVYDVTALAGADLALLIRDKKLNAPQFLDALHAAASSAAPYEISFQELLRRAPVADRVHLLLPLSPPEIWGVGVSYRRAAELHEEDLKAVGAAHRSSELYSYVFASKRPELFFKGVARHCVGHNESIGIRGDSTGTMVEAELACVYDASGSIVAFTIANDVTAWDIERECPLFLTYAKVFTGSCAIGPCIVPANLVADPSALQITCCIERDGRAICETQGNTRNMHRTLGELTNYLVAYNPVPDGTLLCTGTAVGIPNDMVIEDGDRITISCQHLGTLSNVARRLSGETH